MDPVSRRLLKELNDFQREARNHPEIIELCPADDENLTQWRATLAGLNNTPFQGEERAAISPRHPYVYILS
jgi:peroxin-4